VISPEGRVDRRVLANHVFDDSEDLRRLEQIVHPRVHQARDRLRMQYERNTEIVAIVENCPLLLEKGIDAICDKIVYVHASEINRAQRLAKNRHWSPEEVSRREKYLLGLDIKRQRADYILDNDANVGDCLRHVRHVLSQILKFHPSSS